MRKKSTFEIIETVYSDVVFECQKKFKESCESIETESHSNCLLTVRTRRKLTEIHEIIKNDTKISIHQIGDKGIQNFKITLLLAMFIGLPL